MILHQTEFLKKLKTSRGINDSALSSTDSNTQHRIMIVEDDQDIAQIFTITLEDNGFAVDVFNDPLSALSSYKAGYYDLLLLDIRMPGMNGFELYRRIKDIDDKTQVCFITARMDAIDEFRTLFPDLQEADCFVRKPVEMHNLVKIVKSKVNYS
jgi:DNA-binding response OmpR family regulator